VVGGGGWGWWGGGEGGGGGAVLPEDCSSVNPAFHQSRIYTSYKLTA